MCAKRRNYIGLANTVHDSALAVVDSQGKVVFAEATERALQAKRAFHQVPDPILWVGSIIDRFCEPDVELVAADTWLRRKWRGVLFRALYHLLGKRIPELLRPIVVGQMNSFELTGLNLAYRVSERSPSMPPLIRRYYDHHLTHAAAACFSSPFGEAVCAVIDGEGEAEATSFFHFDKGRLIRLSAKRRKSFVRNGSLGAFYAGLCLACGFDPLLGEEWKVMGLAPWGKRNGALYDRLRRLLRVNGLSLVGNNSEIFDTFLAMRPAGDRASILSADLACTGQEVFADISKELLDNLLATGRSKNLVLAGGCALNSSWNGRVLEQVGFEKLYVFSAPADDGNAVGAALLAYGEDHDHERPRAEIQSPFLGSEVDAETLARLERMGRLRNCLPAGEAVGSYVARHLATGKIVGWVQGRAEFGPRALGNRSILADPRRADIKDILNARVKFREEFRPFAPSILHEHGGEYFENYQESPYMERTLRFRPEARARVPGVVHVDGTGRLQTVKREWNPAFHDLLSAFHRLTGCPLLLNTSFNVMGKPIIHSVEDALAVFFTTGLDVLVIHDKVFEKQ